MRIHLIIISAIICTFPASAETWVFDNDINTFYLTTQHDNNLLKINYCFVFDHGNKINCMDTNTFQKTHKINGCFYADKIKNSWNDKTFELSICMDNNKMQWSASSEDNIPKNIVLTKE